VRVFVQRTYGHRGFYDDRGALAFQGFSRENEQVEDLFGEMDLVSTDFQPGDIIVAEPVITMAALRRAGVTESEPDFFPTLMRRANKWMDNIPRLARVRDVRKAIQGDLFRPLWLRQKSWAKKPILVPHTSGIIKLEHLEEDEWLWTHDLIDFSSKYRVYIRNGEFLTMALIDGDPLARMDRVTLNQMIPQLCALPGEVVVCDIGVANFPERPSSMAYPTLFIQKQDILFASPVGLSSSEYIDLLRARWLEVTHEGSNT